MEHENIRDVLETIQNKDELDLKFFSDVPKRKIQKALELLNEMSEEINPLP